MRNILSASKKLTLMLALIGALASLGTKVVRAQAQDQTPAQLTPEQLAAELRKEQPAKTIQHDFVVIDEGLGTLMRINERDASQNWRVTTELPQARDMQLIGHGRLLVGYDGGYAEFDLATGKMLKKFSGLKGVTGARRQPDGSTLITGINLDGQTGVCILHLDAADKVIGCILYPGDYVRLMRQTEQGTFLLCNNTEIREAAPDGRILRTFAVDGFKHAWKAVRLANNNMVISGGYGAFMVELDKEGNVIRKFASKSQVPAEVNSNFSATFQILPNGNIVLANWQGHGPKHGASGVQLVEFNPQGNIVWQWSRAALISSLQGVLVLDGLNTSRLYDERTGLPAPMPTTPAASTVSEATFVPVPVTPVTAPAAATSTTAQTADEAAIAAAVEKLRQAMLTASGPALSAIAADNLIYCHSSGKMENKTQFVDTIASGRSVFVTLELTDQIIKITGDTAIVRHKFTAKTNDSGKPGNVAIGIMLVWQKQNGEWKLLGRQAYKL